eukprot:g6900.t1
MVNKMKVVMKKAAQPAAMKVAMKTAGAAMQKAPGKAVKALVLANEKKAVPAVAPATAASASKAHAQATTTIVMKAKMSDAEKQALTDELKAFAADEVTSPVDYLLVADIPQDSLARVFLKYAGLVTVNAVAAAPQFSKNCHYQALPLLAQSEEDKPKVEFSNKSCFAAIMKGKEEFFHCVSQTESQKLYSLVQLGRPFEWTQRIDSFVSAKSGSTSNSKGPTVLVHSAAKCFLRALVLVQLLDVNSSEKILNHLSDFETSDQNWVLQQCFADFFKTLTPGTVFEADAFIHKITSKMQARMMKRVGMSGYNGGGGGVEAPKQHGVGRSTATSGLFPLQGSMRGGRQQMTLPTPQQMWNQYQLPPQQQLFCPPAPDNFFTGMGGRLFPSLFVVLGGVTGKSAGKGLNPMKPENYIYYPKGVCHPEIKFGTCHKRLTTGCNFLHLGEPGYPADAVAAAKGGSAGKGGAGGKGGSGGAPPAGAQSAS